MSGQKIIDGLKEAIAMAKGENMTAKPVQAEKAIEEREDEITARHVWNMWQLTQHERVRERVAPASLLRLISQALAAVRADERRKIVEWLRS